MANHLKNEHSPYLQQHAQKILLTGIHGEKKHLKKHEKRTKPFSSLLGTVHAIGVMSWRMNLLKMKRPQSY